MALKYIDRVTTNQSAFQKKVIDIAQKLAINPNWLMSVMWSESGLNPQAYNPNGGATGLIQFMPATASGLGTSTAALMQMTNVQQLDYVLKYFLPYKGKIKNLPDLYLITFYPYAVGKPQSYVLGSEKGADYVQLVAQVNSGIDLNKDGKITKGEFYKWIEQRFPDEDFTFLMYKSYGWFYLGGAMLFFFIIYLSYKNKKFNKKLKEFEKNISL